MISSVQASKLGGTIKYYDYPLWGYNFYVDIDPRINFYTEDGYSVNTELCQGQKFKVDSSVQNGEWEEEGGYFDTPPVVWVDNITKFEEQVNKSTEGRNGLIITGIDKYDVYLDNLTGTSIPVYPIYVGGCSAPLGYGGPWVCYDTKAYVNVVCDKPRITKLDISGANSLSEDVFIVTATDKMDMLITGASNCRIYHFCVATTLRGASTYPELIHDCIISMYTTKGWPYCYYGSWGCKLIEGNMMFSTNRTIAVTSNPSKPIIHVSSMLTNDKLFSNSSTYMKLKITNGGVKDVIVKDINLNVNSRFLGCNSTKLSPNESTECVFWLSPGESSTLEATVKYQFLMCGKRELKAERFVVGDIKVEATKCSKNSDCLENYICCENICHDSIKGRCLDVNADGVPEWIPMK